ncbi:MAG: OmpA family protein [Polyangiaceae bacterium]
MTDSASRYSVPGEGAPMVVPLALALVGVAATMLAARAWEGTHDVGWGGAEPTIAVVATASAAATATASVPLVSSAAVPSAKATAGQRATGVAAEPKCTEIVIPFERMALVPSIEGEARIGPLAQWLSSHEEARVTLDGHADSTGSEEGNLVLSRARANAVRMRLERSGIPRERLTVRAFGAFWPEEGIPTDASANRRVVLRVRGKSCPGEGEGIQR